LSAWKDDKTLSSLYLAFSRDSTKKVYVQHLIKEEGAELWKLIDAARAHIYVCGDARNMAPDVYATLVDIIAEHGKFERSAALDYMRRLSKQGRYSADVWS